MSTLSPEVSSVLAKRIARLSDKRLDSRIRSSFKKIAAEIPYIIEMRRRFKDLGQRSGKKILGCSTWTEYCNKRLQRTDRAVQMVIKKAIEEEEPTTINVFAKVEQAPLEPRPITVDVTGERYEIASVASVQPKLPEPELEPEAEPESESEPTIGLERVKYGKPTIEDVITTLEYNITRINERWPRGHSKRRLFQTLRSYADQIEKNERDGY